MKESNILLSEYKLNNHLTIKNRIVMAPMTRAKTDVNGVPTEAMAQYYARRADAGLIITEGTVIRPDALGYPKVPGIFNAAQIAGWKAVTTAVHQNNGHIFMQLWHVGRVSHPNFLQGQLPLSASETVMQNPISRSPGLTYGRSRAATLQEIQEVVQAYAVAAKNAMAAGFDGVEIHGANGYLIDQFLHYHTNHRTDAYGGSPENRARFALEVVQKVGEAIGYEHLGLRLSPGAYLNEIIGDVRDAAVFQHLLHQLNNYPIAYIHTGNFNDAQHFPELNHMTMTAFLRTHYQGTLIASGSYHPTTGHEGILRGEFNLLAIGRPFIANPDLIQRLRNHQEIVNYEVEMLDTLI